LYVSRCHHRFVLSATDPAISLENVGKEEEEGKEENVVAIVTVGIEATILDEILVVIERNATSATKSDISLESARKKRRNVTAATVRWVFQLIRNITSKC
jgi:hypothetical protein